MRFVIANREGQFLNLVGWGELRYARLFTPAVVPAILRKHHDAFAIRVAIGARRKCMGFVLLMEMLVMTIVMLTLAAVAIPNIVQIRAAANQQEARARVYQVFNASAAATICGATPGCAPSTALTALIPQPGTISTGGYTFNYSQNGAAWAFTAAPITAGFSGHAIYTATQTGVTCTIGGAACH